MIRAGTNRSPIVVARFRAATMILFCPISDAFPTPRFSGHTFAIDDATRVCTNRTAADSAAADLIFSHSVRLGAKCARTTVRVYAAEDSRNLNRREL